MLAIFLTQLNATTAAVLVAALVCGAVVATAALARKRRFELERDFQVKTMDLKLRHDESIKKIDQGLITSHRVSD